MLGKGLESLIPPHQNKFGTGQASDQNPVTQQAGNGAGKFGAGQQAPGAWQSQ